MAILARMLGAANAVTAFTGRGARARSRRGALQGYGSLARAAGGS